MRELRVQKSTYVLGWIVTMAVASFGLWWWSGVSDAMSRAGGVSYTGAAPTPPARVPPAKGPSTPVQKHPRKKSEPAPDYPAASPAPQPVVQPVPVASPAPVTLGKVEAGPEKRTAEAEDGSYVAKVVRCSKPLHPGWIVGDLRDGTWDYALCLDAGNGLLEVRASDKVLFDWKDGQHYVRELRVNDVVRVRVNDGKVLKLEVVRVVEDQ